MADSTLVDIFDLDDPADDEDNDGFYDFLEDERLDNETAGVMQMRVAPSTRNGYLGRNVSFMVWLFDRRVRYSNLIELSLLSKLLEAHNVDRGIINSLRRICTAGVVSELPFSCSRRFHSRTVLQ